MSDKFTDIHRHHMAEHNDKGFIFRGTPDPLDFVILSCKFLWSTLNCTRIIKEQVESSKVK